MRSSLRFDTARYGPAAIVAGAAEGIGAAFAEELARTGLDLVLVDLREEALGELAARLERAHGARARCVVADLAEPGASRAIESAAAGWDVGLLVYNAAFAPVGPFASTPLSEQLRTIDVNNRGVVALLDVLVPRMVARGRGGLLLMGSNAGLIGHPLTAVYGASKAFLVRLGEALHAELHPAGVDVLVACPGAVATPGLFRSGAKLPAGVTASPEEVASEALACLGGSRPVVSLGRANRAAMRVLSALPRAVAVRLLGRVMRSTYRAR